MSLGKAIGYLRTLGFTGTDALVYIFLAKKGPHQEDNIACTLNLTTDELRLSLKALLVGGMIHHVPKHPSIYFAVPFEEILDERVKAVNDNLRALLASKAALLDKSPSTNEKWGIRDSARLIHVLATPNKRVLRQAAIFSQLSHTLRFAISSMVDSEKIEELEQKSRTLEKNVKDKNHNRTAKNSTIDKEHALT